MTGSPLVAVIRGDGIGGDVTDAALAFTAAALARRGLPAIRHDDIVAGAAYFAETGRDIEADGETRAGAADAMFLGAIGLPQVRYPNGTEFRHICGFATSTSFMPGYGPSALIPMRRSALPTRALHSLIS